MPVQIWNTWNTANTLTTGTTDAWLSWQLTATQTATTCNQIWAYWTNDTTTATGAAYYGQLTNQQNAQMQQHQHQPTPEALAALAEQRRHYEEIAAKERKAREEAEARAEKLLLENLSLKQREQYSESRHFVVERGDRRYRIRRGRSGNVDVIDKKGCITHRLCAHPAEGVPDPDTMLAQKLMLEHDDDHFLRVANRHAAFDCTTPVLPALQ